MKNSDLIKACATCVEQFAKEVGALKVEFFENKKDAVWSVTLNLIKAQFIYHKKSSLNVPASTLYCKIFPQKNSNLFAHIPQIISYLKLGDFRCYYFPFIENGKRMTACFHALSSFIQLHLNEINEISVSSEFEKFLIDELKTVVAVTDADIPQDKGEREYYFSKLQDFVSNIQVNHYTRFAAYDLFVEQRYRQSLKEYDKFKKRNTLFEYEKQLVAFIDSIKYAEEPFEAVSGECASIIEVKQYNGNTKTDRQAFLLALLLSWGTLTVPILFIMVIINYHYTKETILCDSLPLWWAPIFSTLSAFFLAVGIVDKVEWKLQKNKTAYRDFSRFTAPKVTMKIGQALAVICLVAILIFLPQVSSPYVKCYDDYMMISTNEGLSNEYVKYNYADINAIYHVDGRYNVYGDYIDRESYILCFDGANIDTDAMEFSKEEIENQFLPLFTDYIMSIQNVKTEENIE